MSHFPIFHEDFPHLSEGEVIFRLIRAGIADSAHARQAAYDDETFVSLGLRRVFERHHSGREFVQSCIDQGAKLSRSSYFEALVSPRRACMIVDVAREARRHCGIVAKSAGVDALAEHMPELNGLEVLAVDGHHVSHACHDPRDSKGAAVSVSSLYLLNLRNGLAESMAPVAVAGTRKHEMPVFREVAATRRGPTVYVGDRAYLDHRFWDTARKGSAYVVTRLKSEAAPLACGEICFDRDDPINAGVSRVRLVGFSNSSACFYLVDYTAPETGESYEFLTTLNLSGDVRPGVVCCLYKLRWRIEKSFDNFKNDFAETKAWASGANALVVQTSCIATAYNLVRMLEFLLRIQGIHDEKVARKRVNALAKREAAAVAAGRKLHPVERLLPHFPRISSQFIRAVRNHLHCPLAILALLPMFRSIMHHYL